MKRRVAMVLLLAGVFVQYAWAQESLFDAVRSGNMAEVQTLLNNGADVNAKNIMGDTPLRWAAIYGFVDIAKVLLAHGANPNVENVYGATPLNTAVYMGQASVAKTLIEGGAIETLADAAGLGDRPTINVLLARNADVNAGEGEYALTPLDLASNADVAGVLIAHGADVNRSNDNGMTPLSEAKSKDIAEMLIAHGAEVDSRRGRYDMTPLSWIAQSGRMAVAEVLIAHGADVNAKDGFGSTPLVNASVFGHADVAEVLLAHGADVNAKDRNGNPLLVKVSEDGHADVAEVLLAHGADVNAKDKEGDTSLASTSSEAVAEVLIAHGADMFSKDNNGRTPLDIPKTSLAINALIQKALQSGKPPAIPEEARRHYVMGSTALKQASSPSDFDEAIRQFQQAVQLAPWWANAYNNLGAVLYGRERYADAINAWKLYLVAAPQAADARAVQDRIYATQEKAKLGASQ